MPEEYLSERERAGGCRREEEAGSEEPWEFAVGRGACPLQRFARRWRCSEEAIT